jgi:hypothetical protein
MAIIPGYDYFFLHVQDSDHQIMHSPIQDIRAGLRSWRLALHWAWMDTKLKYRRSVIGPLWITISVGATILGMGGEKPTFKPRMDCGR